MAGVHEGADEEGHHLLAFFYSNPLVREVYDKSGTFVKEEVDRLAHEEERRMVESNLSDLGRQIRFCSEPATTWNVLNRLNNGCKMLHFTGHGSCHCLSFEDEEARRCGIEKHLKEEGLKELFEAGATKPELVFLASCCSETLGNTLVDAGVPHVVAVDSDVPDEAARIFSRTFYHALIAPKQTVKNAFDIAVNAVNIKALDASEMFLLLPPKGDHEVRMFDDLPKGRIVNETPQLPPKFRLPDARRKYYGGVGLQQAVQVLQDPNAVCVSIIGEPGVGKTQRALQACHYVRERAGFDAIFYADCKHAVISSPHRFLAMEGSRPETERPYMQHFCRLIGWTLGVPPESRPSVQALWGFMLESATKEIGQRPYKVLLVLDSVDILYEAGENEARQNMIATLDELCHTSENLTLLLTCKEKLLRERDEYIGRTKELVHEVRPLEGRDPALLLLDLSPRDSGVTYEDIDAQNGCDYNGCLKHILKLELMKVVGGHPGTLCLVGPLLLDNSFNDTSVKDKAARYREWFMDVGRNPFSEKSASDIAVKAGLKNRRGKLVWVRATARAEAEGQSIRDGKCDTYYRSVPWSSLSFSLRHALSNLPTSEPTRSFKPRRLDDHHLKFIRERLREAREAVHGKHELTQPEDDVEDTICLKTFVKFCQGWWEPVMTTLSRIPEEWASDNPVKVHGFIGGLEAERKLSETNQRGMFLLRFSTSEPGKLILTFTYEACQSSTIEEACTDRPGDSPIAFQHSRITVQQDRRCTLHSSKRRRNLTYSSLGALVLHKPMFQTLYPSVEKRRAFEPSHILAPQISGLPMPQL